MFITHGVRCCLRQQIVWPCLGFTYCMWIQLDLRIHAFTSDALSTCPIIIHSTEVELLFGTAAQNATAGSEQSASTRRWLAAFKDPTKTGNDKMSFVLGCRLTSFGRTKATLACPCQATCIFCLSWQLKCSRDPCVTTGAWRVFETYNPSVLNRGQGDSRWPIVILQPKLLHNSQNFGELNLHDIFLAGKTKVDEVNRDSCLIDVTGLI